MSEVAANVADLVIAGHDITVKHGWLCKDCGKNELRYSCRRTGGDCQPFEVITLTSKKTFGAYK